MNFKGFQTELKRRLTRDNDTGEIDTLAKSWINTSVRRVLRERAWRDARRRKILTTVASQENYILPYDLGSIAFIWHRIYGYNYRMAMLPEGNFVKRGLIGTTEGVPYVYRSAGYERMMAQPSAASVISLVSSNAADTSIVLVKGLVSGYPDYEEVTLTGVTPKATAKSFTEITSLISSSSLTGRVTATSNSGAVTIGVIPAGLLEENLQRDSIDVTDIPDTADNSMYVHYNARHLEMVSDYDSPILGDDFNEAILTMAEKIGLGSEEGMREEAKGLWLDYKDEIVSLKRADSRKFDDWTPIMASFRNQPSRGLNFGAYYPNVYI